MALNGLCVDVLLNTHSFIQSYLSFQVMTPTRARRPLKRLGDESVETLHNPIHSDVPPTDHEEICLVCTKTKRHTLTDVSKT